MKRKSAGWIGLCALLGGGVWFFLQQPVSVPKSAVPLPPMNPVLEPATRPAATVAATPVPIAVAALAERFTEVLNQLRASPDAATARKLLAQLRAALASVPPQIASNEIQAFLETRQDAPTKLDLTIQPGGALGDCSSLRVLLLDYLGKVDRPAAGQLARQILSTPSSADEWTVSLRNFAWSDSSAAGQAFLLSKTSELMQNAAWRENPSVGYLEAFDTVVYARGFELTGQLAELVRDKDHRAVAHAAYLTLDRLTLTDPALALSKLSEQPDLMAGREQTRANFFARADLRDPKQKTLIEAYLLDPSRSAVELQTFTGLFPNANFMISNNLLTSSDTPDHAALAARDRAALAVIEAWTLDPRFAKIAPQLETTRSRLRRFVQQADGK